MQRRPAASVIALLEVVEWTVARQALRRNPDVSPERIYAARPLDRKQRRRVTFNLVMVAVLYLFLISFESDAEMFRGSAWGGAIILFVAMAPGALALYRVRRKNSWLAVSWLPARPRKSPA